MSFIIEKALPEDAAALLEYLKQIGSESDNLSFGSEGLGFTVEAEERYLSSIETHQTRLCLSQRKTEKL